MPRPGRVGLIIAGPIMAAVFAACSPAGDETRATAPVDANRPPRLTLLGEFTRPAGSSYPTLAESDKFGELSGLVRDPLSGQWLGVVDDRDSRLAWLNVSFDGGVLSVSPVRLMRLQPGEGISEPLATRADLEGIAALPDGTFLLAEEGHIENGVAAQPMILHANRDGQVLQLIALPTTFELRLDQQRGIRAKQGFESLTRLPGGHLIAGLEQPLIEDGPTPTFEHGANGRLAELVPDGTDWRPGRQWTYPIDPTPRVSGFEGVCDTGENGLVELLGLTDTTLLSMERACLQNPQTAEVTVAVRLFLVELTAGEVKKTPVLDLQTLAPHLSPALQRLENFEGMAFGPPTRDGRRTLLLVSDDNRRPTQHTAFLLFSLE